MVMNWKTIGGTCFPAQSFSIDVSYLKLSTELSTAPSRVLSSDDIMVLQSVRKNSHTDTSPHLHTC